MRRNFRRAAVALKLHSMHHTMKTRLLLSTEITSRRVVVLSARFWSTYFSATPCRTISKTRFSARRDALERLHLNVSGIYTFERDHPLRSIALNPISRRFSTLDVRDTDISVRADFWGEPVTFLTVGNGEGNIETAVTAMDDFCIAVVSRGGSCSGGGDDEGVPTMAAHSAGIVWAECLRQAALWHESAPMLAVLAVGPLLTHANVGYLNTLDSLLEQVVSGVDATVSLLDMTKAVVAMKDDERLTTRERSHLEALHHLLQHERREALDILLKALQQAPGDALALCLAIDLANAIGDRKSALRYACT